MFLAVKDLKMAFNPLFLILPLQIQLGNPASHARLSLRQKHKCKHKYKRKHKCKYKHGS